MTPAVAPSSLALPRATSTMLLAALPGAVVVGAASGLQPVAGLAAVIAIGIALWSYAHPGPAAAAVVCLAPALSGLRRGLPVPGLRLSELLIVGMGTMVLLRGTGRSAEGRWKALDWSLLAYCAATLAFGSFDVLARHDDFHGDAVGTLVGPFQFLLLYRTAAVGLTTPVLRRLALRGLLLASAVVAITANLQLFDVGPTRALLTYLTGVDIYGPYSNLTIPARVTGPFPFWHALGGYLYITMLAGVALLFEREQRVLRRGPLLAVILLDAAALIETATIAPIVGGLIGAVVLGTWYGRGRQILAAVGMATIVVVVASVTMFSARYQSQFGAPPGSGAGHTVIPSTLVYRWDIWETQNLPALAGHWITGYGPDLPPGLAFPYTESLYLSLLFRGGVLLAAIFLFLTYLAFVAARSRARSSEPETRAAARVVAYTFVSLTFIHFIESYLVDSGPPHALWALLGVASPLAMAASPQLRGSARRGWAGSARASGAATC